MDQEIKGEFAKMANQFENLAVMIKTGFDSVDERFKSVDKRFVSIDERFAKIEGQMVTKTDLVETRKGLRKEIRKSELRTQDFVENKLADLRGDLVLLMRKEDTKLFRLVEILHGRRVINKGEVRELTGMEPFPKVVA